MLLPYGNKNKQKTDIEKKKILFWAVQVKKSLTDRDLRPKDFQFSPPPLQKKEAVHLLDKKIFRNPRMRKTIEKTNGNTK